MRILGFPKYCTQYWKKQIFKYCGKIRPILPNLSMSQACTFERHCSIYECKKGNISECRKV